jgi:hypothetical protein
MLALVEPDLYYATVALAAFTCIVALVIFGRPSRLFTGGRGRLPRRFEVKDIPTGDIPADAQRPLDFLTDKLSSLGFEVADLPVRVPALQSFGYRLLIVPFVHRDEGTVFLMGIEAGLHPRTQLMLHIITPLSEGRRVETTTLEPLEGLIRPKDVDVRVVLDAESVEEIWSRHRLALNNHERSARAGVDPDHWRELASAAYDGWVQAAVRSQRLQLEKNGEMYKVRGRPKSVI